MSEELYHIFEILKKAKISFNPLKANFSKKSVEILLNELGNPQDKLQIIHVTGTKGKGSTCYYSNRILQKMGFRVGMYLSPHIESFFERIQINEIPISLESFIQILNLLKKVQNFHKMHVSLFEILTVVAFQYFYQNKVNFVLIEVGIGGRLDATNCIKNPIACLFSEIGLDHTNLLGNSLEKIILEKAGIVKKNCTVFCINQKPIVLNVLKKISFLNSANFFLYNFQEKNLDKSCENFIPSYKLKNLLFSKFILSKIFPQFLRKIYSTTINLDIIGRFEIINNNIILDVAHNLISIKVLSRNMEKFCSNFPEKKINVIFFCLKDKNESLLFSIFPTKWIIYFYKLKNIPFYEDQKRLIKKINNPKRYMNILKNFSEFEKVFLKNQKDFFLITGSFHIVSLFRRKIKESNSIQNIINANSQ